MQGKILKLNTKGIYRKLDNLNRIVIPKEIIKQHTINEKEPIGFQIQDTEEQFLLLKPVYE